MKKLIHTRKALEEYDTFESYREMLYQAADTDERVTEWQEKCDQDLDKVRLAFFQDTKGLNSLDKCMLVDLQTLRDWVDNEDVEE